MSQENSYLKALKKFWEITDPTELKFNRVDTLYNEDRTDELFDALVEERVAWLLRNLELPENPKILEIGCGIGSVIKSISQKLSKNAFFYGVDISSTMIEESKINLRLLTNVNLETTDGISLPSAKDDSIDLVICSGVFIHITDLNVISSIISEAKRVLKPNGHFRFNVRYWNPETTFKNTLGGRIAKLLIRNKIYNQSPKLKISQTDFDGFKFSLNDIDEICYNNKLCLNSIYFQNSIGKINNGLIRISVKKI